MSDISGRGAWNAANARRANKPFEDLFQETVVTTTEIPQLTIMFDAETPRELVAAVEHAAADKARELGLSIITAVYPVTTIDNLEEIIRHADETETPTPAAAG